ncbi:MAG: transposase [Gemmatimonadales bacterium]
MTNRGVARRAIFEAESEIRFFLSLVARAVHRRWWKVHAYAVLHTHFHLLVSVQQQSLSRTMRWVLFRYARRFNRRRRREGPLFTSRFFSRPVHSPNYRRIAVSYIDNNPVAAGLAPSASGYPYGSARYYKHSGTPPWLDRGMVQGLLHDLLGKDPSPEDYEALFAGKNHAAEKWQVERRPQDHSHLEDPLDDLLTAPTDRVRAWLVRRATLADGKDLRPPLVTPQAVDESVDRRTASYPSWKVRIKVRASPGWQILRIGLLYDAARLTGSEIAGRVFLSKTQIQRRVCQHRRLLVEDTDYANRSAAVLHDAIQRDQEASA